MPKIGLVEDNITPTEVLEPLEKAKKVLSNNGLDDLATVRSDVINALNANGAGIEQSAAEIARAMLYADQDTVRFQAAKESLKLHGAYGESAGDDGRVVFIVNGDAQLNNIFNPERNNNVDED